MSNIDASIPQVSVNMPVFDPNPVYFRDAIQSILRQTFQDYEFLIIEDPSPRSAKEIVAEFDDPRIRYICNTQRTSLVEQRNRGLAEARAEFVALLDADDIAEPNRLRKQLDYLKSHPDIAVLGCNNRIIDSQGRLLGYRSYPLEHDAIVSALRRYNALSQPSVMFRRLPVLEAGGYRYGKYPTEDYELWCRLAAQGLRFANYPQPLLSHRIHPHQQKNTALRRMIQGTLSVKNMYWRGQMNLADRARLWCERLLLVLPPPLVLWLFLKIQYAQRAPTEDIAEYLLDSEGAGHSQHFRLPPPRRARLQ